MEKIRSILSIIFLIAVLTVSGCDDSNKSIGGKTMSDVVKVNVVEQENSNDAMVEIILLDEFLAEYANAGQIEIVVDGMTLAFFEGMACYWPEEFGHVECEIVVYSDDGIELARVTDEFDLSLKTWFVQLKTGEGGDNFQFTEGEIINVFSLPRARGNDDICWMYKLRIPEGKSLTLTTEIEFIGTPDPAFSGVLAVHARRAEYANRFDLYEYPDDAYKHIDADVDLWEGFPLTLEEGVHTIYICPSVRHDLSLLTVLYTGDKSGGHSGYFKSIDYEALGL